MTAALPLPLPIPRIGRWQPLRMGLVELYHYDCEEFWFRDGHLLLRGNNGTGKSKVLSLTLPFLLDAALAAARVEPDGDPGKRMEWNLLMGRHERRTGYAWIEFGRLDEEGRPGYVTLGCGLAALAGRSRVDHWHFITEQRVGETLFLITTERLVLTRERLAEALGDRGQVFDTARDYRRAVDERLFKLGEERYGALIDTLITLRQPQLSKRPDEENLSRALTEALPPLAQPALEDVAEAMTELDKDRDETASLQALLSAVVQFQRRYRAYASVNARREAKRLRQAQTDFDNASRALNEARARNESARAAAQHSEENHARLDAALARDRAALEELRRDPAMRDAQRLQACEEEARERREDASRALGGREASARRWEEARSAAAARRSEVSDAQARLESERAQAGGLATESGLASEHAGLDALLVPFERLADRPTQEIDQTERALRLAQKRRQEQVGRVRAAMEAVARTARDRDVAARAREESAASFETAQARSLEAARALACAVERHVEEWSTYVRSTVFALPQGEGEMDDLSAWAQSLMGEHPMRTRLASAHAQALRGLAAQEAAADRGSSELRRNRQELEEEGNRLREGGHPVPPAPYVRDPQSRERRAGAPLWQLLEFREHLSEASRAGLEAALEACGLLDAWMTPEGEVIDPRTSDALLVVRAPRASSLSAWLSPAPGASVSASRIEAILESVECAPEDPGTCEAWVAPDGRYRLGLAAGAWRKAAPQYIGYAAREAARHRRLEEIAAGIASIEIDLARVTALLEELEGKRRALEADVARAPGDGALRDAHARSSGMEALRRDAQEHLARAEARLNAAENSWRQAQRALEQDGEDLRLPVVAIDLQRVESRLMEYGPCAAALVQAARGCRTALLSLARQQQREAEAQSLAEAAALEWSRRQRAAEVAAARRDELRQTVGAAVAEIGRRLAEREDAVRAGSEGLKAEGERRLSVREEAARTGQRMHDAQQALDEQQARRQEAVARLRDFALTGLMSVALPELELPPGEWTIDPALSVARRVEQSLLQVAADDADWNRVMSALSEDFTTLMQAMSAQGHVAQAEPCPFGMVVRIVHHNRAERPDVLARRLEGEVAQRREILTAKERAVLENHLEAEIAASLQRLLLEAERRVQKINAELSRRPTSTGVRFKLEWQPLPEGDEGAPVGLDAARSRLLNTAADAWSAEDRRLVGEFLQRRIQAERTRDDGGSLPEHLSRALDYRRWHRFRVKRFQDGAWRPLSGPASSGERALGLTVPLFAAASSHYASGEYRDAPRLVLLDEAFAGIDDEARAHCMGLIREFDLDFVMTSEREWGCYAELPGLAICHLVRREGVDAVFVSRWSWDGKARREEADPSRRYPEQVAAS